MLLLCRVRKDGNDSVNPVCQGNCKEFIKHYLKYNIRPEDYENHVVLETTPLDMKEFLPSKGEDVPLVPEA